MALLVIADREHYTHPTYMASCGRYFLLMKPNGYRRAAGRPPNEHSTPRDVHDPRRAAAGYFEMLIDALVSYGAAYLSCTTFYADGQQ